MKKILSFTCAALLVVASSAFAASGSYSISKGEGSYTINLKGSAALADDGIDTTYVVLADLGWNGYDTDGAALLRAIIGIFSNQDAAGDSSQAAIDMGVRGGGWIAAYTLAADATNLDGAEAKGVVITQFGPVMRVIIKNVSGAAEQMNHVLSFSR